MADALRPELHRYAARLMGPVIEGEEVVQDKFLRALAALDALAPGTPLRPWLFRIAHNRAIDLLRRGQRWSMDPVEHLPEDPAPDAEAATIAAETLSLAVARFAALPGRQRAAVLMKDVLDEPLSAIAAHLGLSLDAVKAHLARGRARLRVAPPQESTPQQPTPPASPRCCTSPRSSTVRTGARCGRFWRKRCG